MPKKSHKKSLSSGFENSQPSVKCLFYIHYTIQCCTTIFIYASTCICYGKLVIVESTYCTVLGLKLLNNAVKVCDINLTRNPWYDERKINVLYGSFMLWLEYARNRELGLVHYEVKDYLCIIASLVSFRLIHFLYLQY